MVEASARYPGVDPQMVAGLELWGTPVDPSDLAAFRNRPAPPEPADLAAPVRRELPGLEGEPPVRVLVLNEKARGGTRGALLWLHGGGFVGGTTDIPVPVRRAAAEYNWLVVSVDYRLAPEAAFPAALHDAIAALRWIHAQSDVDRGRVAIGGVSAGGGHAAMLTIAARGMADLPIAFQLLIYPMLDDRTGSSRPAPDGAGRYIWTPEANRFGWTSLLGVPAGSSTVPKGAVPARETELTGLPPAFIGVGSIDLFCEEDIAYATHLAAAGVPMQLEVVPGAYHGFERLAPNAVASQRFNARWMEALTAALQPRR